MNGLPAGPLHSWLPDFPEVRLDPVCHTKRPKYGVDFAQISPAPQSLPVDTPSAQPLPGMLLPCGVNSGQRRPVDVQTDL